MKVDKKPRRFGLSQARGSQEKRTRRITDTLRGLRTQMTTGLAKSHGGAGGLEVRQAGAAKVSGGFSVVELILAIVVGGLFLLSLAQITNNYVILGGKSRSVVLSNSYAEGKLETLRNIGFKGLSNGTTDVSSELPAQLPGPKNASLVISTPQTNLKKAELAVTYSDRGVSRTANYAVYIGEISDLQ